jgi:hypothetical protein
MSTAGSVPGGKMQSECDADHSPHLMAGSRMSRSYTSSPPCLLHGGSGTALLHFVTDTKHLRRAANIPEICAVDTFIRPESQYFLENGMFCCVVSLKYTDVSEIRTVSIFWPIPLKRRSSSKGLQGNTSQKGVFFILIVVKT